MAKCCDIKIGELRHQVIIQEQLLTDDGSGGQDITWPTLYSPWAGIKQMSAGELYQHEKLETQATHKFTMRYDSRLKETMRILFRDELYNIKGIDNLEFRNQWLIVIAKRGVVQ